MARRNDDALILFPGALGDFVCFLPTLCALRSRHRGRLLVVVKPALAELIDLPGSSTASIDRREIADLFSTAATFAPETRILFHGFPTSYSWTGYGDPAFAQRIAAVTGGTVHVHAFRGMQPGEHAVDYYAACAEISPVGHIGAVLRTDSHWLAGFERTHQLGGRRVVLLHAGSGSPRKNWLGFNGLSQYWRARYDDVILRLHGPAEPPPPRDAELNVLRVGGLSLPQVVALLRRAALYVGNDSGISHLAGAVGVGGVVVFGPSDPATWAPRSESLRVVTRLQTCTRCAAEAFCTHQLPVAVVLDELERARRHSRTMNRPGHLRHHLD